MVGHHDEGIELDRTMDRDLVPAGFDDETRGGEAWLVVDPPPEQLAALVRADRDEIRSRSGVVEGR
jgi:hypothetical protein